jgi:hypothetical protein|tara:strand:+ start:192 stop:779 length:588 start_codon:yes stop_codon:yes gene_type:complete
MIYREQVAPYGIGQRLIRFPLFSFIASCQSLLRFSYFLLLIALPLNTTSASDFEFSRIANELNLASYALAKEQGVSTGFSGLSHRASSLARESSQLIDAIHRTRNPSNIRSQFNDVSRRYTDLEDIFWRGYRNSADNYVLDKLEVISRLYNDLVAAYTLSRYYQGAPQIHIYLGSGPKVSGFPVSPIFFNPPDRP